MRSHKCSARDGSSSAIGVPRRQAAATTLATLAATPRAARRMGCGRVGAGWRHGSCVVFCALLCNLVETLNGDERGARGEMKIG